MASILEELKRRRVFRIAGVYTVVAWAVIQVADTVLPALQMPEWTVSFVTIIFILGFPVALILAWAFQITPDGVIADVGPQADQGNSRSKDSTLVYATFALVLLVVGLQFSDRFYGNTPSQVRLSGGSGAAQTIRSSLDLGLSIQQPIINLHHEFSFSPDGGKLAYSGVDESGRAKIKVRNLSDGSTITATEQGGPFTPRFSPNGNLILYADVVSSALHVVPATGGRSREILTTANLAMGANWLDEQTIVYTNAEDGSLYSTSINNVEPRPLNIPAQAGERQSWPSLVPGGDWLIYTVTTESDFYEGRIDAYNFESGVVKNLVVRGYNASYAASGHIVFMRDDDLWAAACDPAKDQECIIESQLESGVAHHRVLGITSYSISSNGLLIFHQKLSSEDASGELRRVNELVWKTLDGTDIPHNLPLNAYVTQFSPKGTHVVFNLRNSDGGRDIGVYNILQKSIERRSFTGEARSGIWSSDGEQLAYSVSNGHGSDLWITNADGSGQPRRLIQGAAPLRANSFSPDNSVLIFMEGIPDMKQLKTYSIGNAENQIANLFSDAPDDSIQSEGIISPDGRWIAYTSRELGDFEVFVRPFPNVEDGKWQITYGGGMDPLWTADTSRLYYLNVGDSAIYRVDVQTEPIFGVGTPKS